MSARTDAIFRDRRRAGYSPVESICHVFATGFLDTGRDDLLVSELAAGWGAFQAARAAGQTPSEALDDVYLLGRSAAEYLNALDAAPTTPEPPLPRGRFRR